MKPGERGRGIGGILTAHLCKTAQLMGYKEISLGVNLDNLAARHLYRKHGFTTVFYMGRDADGEYEKLLKLL